MRKCSNFCRSVAVFIVLSFFLCDTVGTYSQALPADPASSFTQTQNLAAWSFFQRHDHDVRKVVHQKYVTAEIAKWYFRLDPSKREENLQIISEVIRRENPGANFEISEIKLKSGGEKGLFVKHIDETEKLVHYVRPSRVEESSVLKNLKILKRGEEGRHPVLRDYIFPRPGEDRFLVHDTVEEGDKEYAVRYNYADNVRYADLDEVLDGSGKPTPQKVREDISKGFKENKERFQIYDAESDSTLVVEKVKDKFAGKIRNVKIALKPHKDRMRGPIDGNAVTNIFTIGGEKYFLGHRKMSHAQEHMVMSRPELEQGPLTSELIRAMIQLTRIRGFDYEVFFNGIGNTGDNHHSQTIRRSTLLANMKDGELSEWPAYNEVFKSSDYADFYRLADAVNKRYQEFFENNVRCNILFHFTDKNETNLRIIIIPREKEKPEGFLEDKKEYGTFGSLEMAGYIAAIKSDVGFRELERNPEKYKGALKDVSLKKRKADRTIERVISSFRQDREERITQGTLEHIVNLMFMPDDGEGQDNEGIASYYTQRFMGEVIGRLYDTHGRRENEIMIEMLARILEIAMTKDESVKVHFSDYKLHSMTEIRARAKRLIDPRRYDRRYDKRLFPKKPKRIFVISRGPIGGDINLTSVVFQKIRQKFPEAKIVFVGGGTGNHKGLFAGFGDIEFVDFKHNKNASFKDQLLQSIEAKQLLEDEGYEEGMPVIDLSGHGLLHGMIPVCSEKDYFYIPMLPEEKKSHGENVNDLLNDILGLRKTHYSKIFLGGELKNAANSFYSYNPWDDDRVVTISFGVGGDYSKAVSPHFEAALIKRLIKENKVVLLDKGFGAEQDRTKEILELLGKEENKIPLVEFDEGTSSYKVTAGPPINAETEIILYDGKIPHFAALVGESSFYMGYDSMGQHLAGSQNVPAAVLFAGCEVARFEEMWRPYSENSMNIKTFLYQVKGESPRMTEDEAIEKMIASLQEKRYVFDFKEVLLLARAAEKTGDDLVIAFDNDLIPSGPHADQLNSVLLQMHNLENTLSELGQDNVRVIRAARTDLAEEISEAKEGTENYSNVIVLASKSTVENNLQELKEKPWDQAPYIVGINAEPEGPDHYYPIDIVKLLQQAFSFTRSGNWPKDPGAYKVIGRKGRTVFLMPAMQPIPYDEIQSFYKKQLEILRSA